MTAPENLIFQPLPSHKKFVDLTGQRFNLLTVLGLGDWHINPKGVRLAKWHCRCECGNITTAFGYNLKDGNSKSCGCHNMAVLLSRSVSHGEARKRKISAEYRAWQGMIARTTKEDLPCFKDYGARGIAVCAEWRDDYPAFLAHVGRRPSPLHSLDRIDNDGNYEPGNVRWATRSEQNSNQRRNRNLEFNGEIKTLCQWAAICGIERRTIGVRLKLGWSVHDALTRPVRQTS